MKRFIFILLGIVLFATIGNVKAQNEQESTIQEVRKTTLTQAERDSILFEKLSPEQILELKKQEMSIEKEKIQVQKKLQMPLGEFAIILIVILPFLFVLAMVIINVKHRNEESQRKYDLYMKSLEKGQSIPEHFFEELKKKNDKSDNLKKGIIPLMTGFAFAIYFIIEQGSNMWILLVALILIFVGLGHMLVYFLEKPKHNKTNTN